MSVTHVVRETSVKRTARVAQLEGMFELDASDVSRVEWSVNLDLPDEWNVGLIVGPSGAGKTTIARELFGANMCDGFEWPKDKSVVDAFPSDMPIKELTMLLSSVGFSSPPSWLRPFHVLSNGEQFRVTMARAIAETSDLLVVDEFTSVVDRNVAKVASAAIAKTVRRRGQQFIALSCHYDIVEWLEPDWVFEPHTGQLARGRLQRPPIEVTIRRVHHRAWELFRHHHYMNDGLSKAAGCFVAFMGDTPIGFVAMLPFPHAHKPGWRLSRAVVLPDYQGLGIGNRVVEAVSAAYAATGKPVFRTMSHPAMVHSCANSPLWRMTRAPSRVAPPGRRSGLGKNLRASMSTNRLTAGFEFIGEPRTDYAAAFGLQTARRVKRHVD